ncbi:hypothetical protein D4740_10260 [Actinomyces sp. 2119]|nr:hypothetical protein D4740_10260 [Actinomyces sp. 2119]
MSAHTAITGFRMSGLILSWVRTVRGRHTASLDQAAGAAGSVGAAGPETGIHPQTQETGTRSFFGMSTPLPQ